MATETKAVPTDKVIENQTDVTKEDKKGSPETNSTQVRLKSINIKLPEDLHRQLKAKSALEGESTANVVKKLIDEYIKKV